MEEEARQMILAAVANKDRPSIGEMLYRASRPGVDLAEVPDAPASYATFDE
jgi:hypothetical protein